MFPLHEALDAATREELSEYDDLIASLLARRGVTTKEAAHAFLNPSYDEHLHDPFLMTDMKKAAERLARAILAHERITAWTDYDCDGVPAAAVLHDFLEKTGADFDVYIPHRHAEGYGMNVAGVERLAKRGTKLIVTADSGITDTEAVARANELGMEVIVTDHHLPGEKLPDALAVVNPNARADEPYPFKGLCGAGVAWKLVVATMKIIRDTSPTPPRLRRAAELPLGWEKWLLDMVALATVADMVPLTDENRVLATFGLIVMRKSPRIGLQKLCRAMRVEQRTLSADDIAFMLAPRVNAASRMDDARDAYRLFVTRDEAEADALAKKLEKLNRSRKAEAAAVTRAAHARLKERAVGDVIVIGDPSWRPALLGLVANTLIDEFERPVFLWGREGSGALKGSVRSGSVHALELMRASDAFTEFGGHAASGGFTLKDESVFDLEARLSRALATLPARDGCDALEARADGEITVREASTALVAKLERLAPYGEKNPKPVFIVRDAYVERVTRFGKAQEHLKLGLRDERGYTADAVAFFAKGRLARIAAEIGARQRVHVLAHVERDAWSRGNPVRLRLLDLKLL